MPYYRIHSKGGGYKAVHSHAAMVVNVPRVGKCAVTVHTNKHSYPHHGYIIQDGMFIQSSMLLYPKGTVCRMYTQDEFIALAKE